MRFRLFVASEQPAVVSRVLATPPALGSGHLAERAPDRSGDGKLSAHQAVELRPPGAEVLVGHPHEAHAERAEQVFDALLLPQLLLGGPPVSRPPVLHPTVELDRECHVRVPAIGHLQQPAVHPQLHLRDERRQAERAEGQPPTGLQPGFGAAVGGIQSSYRARDAGHVDLPVEDPTQFLTGRQAS